MKDKKIFASHLDVMKSIEIIEESGKSYSEEEQIAAWQHLINTGVCWDLQGWYGRTAISLIEDGVCYSVSNR